MRATVPTILLPLLVFVLVGCADGNAVDEARSGPDTAAESAAVLTMISLTVPDMACALCASSIRTQLRAMGVRDLRVDLESKLVTGSYDPDQLSADSIRARIEASGFRVTEVDIE